MKNDKKKSQGTDTPSKLCSSCKQERPLSEFHYKNMDTGQRHAQCAKCLSKTKKIKYSNERTATKRSDIPEFFNQVEGVLSDSTISGFGQIFGKTIGILLQEGVLK